MELKDKYKKEVKHTRISDESEIYNKNREDPSPEERWKEMNRIEKFLYYKDYYLKYTILGLILLIGGIYCIYSITRPPKKDTFYLGMLDGIQFNEDIEEDMPDIFCDYLSNETDYDGFIKNSRIYMDTFYNTIVDNTKLDGFYDKKKFDIFVARPDSLNGLFTNGNLMDLSTILSDDMMSKFEPLLVYGTLDDGTKVPYGITIKDTNYKFYDYKGDEIETCILGIPDNTQRPDVAIEFIKFLFN